MSIPVKDSIKNLEIILNKFSLFIRSEIYKFNIQKKGIDPEDIIQEVRIKIWKIIEEEKIIINYASYIRKIIKSSVIDQIRKYNREDTIIYKKKSEKIHDIKSSIFNKESNIDYDKIIQHALDNLIDSRKKVVRLFLLGLSLEEISIVFNWTNDKTRNLLYRGLHDIKIFLKKYEIWYENK